MHRRFYSQNKIVVVSLAVTLFLSFVPAGHAAPPYSGMAEKVGAHDGIPATHESYNLRPDILETAPKAHPDLGATWERLKRGHMEALAELIELHPDKHLYFLARDSELLYDMAKLIATEMGDQKLLSRIHLLNVSRLTMNDPNLVGYLAQEGISETALKNGKQILFVDTGFAGTIPKTIATKFSESAQRQMKTHLICSENPSIPSVRTFLTELSPGAADLAPSAQHGAIIDYEHMRRFSDRSDRYVKTKLGYEPASPKVTKMTLDGAVNRETAIKYMEDLHSSIKQPGSLRLIEKRRAQWREIYDFIKKKDTAGLKKFLTELLKRKAVDPQAVAMARDALDYMITHVPVIDQLDVTEESLGMKTLLAGKGQGKLSPKEIAIQKYPQWKSVLEDPDSEIPKLLSAGKYEDLSSVLLAYPDAEVFSVTAKSLVQAKDTSAKLNFIKKGMEVDSSFRTHLLSSFFSSNQSAIYDDVLREYVESSAASKVLISNLNRINPLITTYPKTSESMAKSFSIDYVVDLFGPALDQADYPTSYPTYLRSHRRVHTIIFHRLQQIAQFEKLRPSIHVYQENLAHWLIDAATTVEERQQIKTMVLNDPVIPSKVKAAFKKALSKPLFRSETAARRREIFEEVFPDLKREFRSGSMPGAVLSLFPSETKLVIGQPVKLSETLTVDVESYVDHGKRFRVYKVRDTHSKKYYALKVIRDQELDTLASLAKEHQKVSALQASHFPTPRIIANGNDFVLREWVEGTRADVWLKNWEAAGAPEYAPQLDELKKLLSHSAAKGVYIGDLNPKNLIWNNGRWVIIDSGAIEDGKDAAAAMTRFVDKVGQRWGKLLHSGASYECFMKSLKSASDEFGIVID